MAVDLTKFDIGARGQIACRACQESEYLDTLADCIAWADNHWTANRVTHEPAPAPLTPDEFAAAMDDLVVTSGADFERFHGDADGLMCETLRRLGYGVGVDIFERAPKEYA